MNAVVDTQTAPTPFPLQPAHAPVARLHHVTRRYRNGVVALDDLSLELHRGEIVALLGPNGAGKSTTVKLLIGLSEPTAGTVEVFGQSPREATHRLRTGVMLQVGKAPETLRVREHIELFRGYFDRPLPLAELIRVAGLEGLEDRLFGQLSGGQKQRVLFALALAGDPDLVILDEPTTGLDIESRRAIWAQIRALAAAGRTVLLTTHYLEEADALASRIVVMRSGRVVCEGTPAEVKGMGAMRNGTASGAAVRVIRCLTSLPLASLQGLAGVDEVTLVAQSATLTSSAPENTLRALLALDAGLAGLEVRSPALEDAFLALTQ